jgi:hypothetical protein
MQCIVDAMKKLNCNEKEVFGYYARSITESPQIASDVKNRAWKMYISSGRKEIPHEMLTWLLALQTGLFELDGARTYPLKARKK